MNCLALLSWQEDPTTADPQTPEFAEDVTRYAALDEKAGEAVVDAGSTRSPNGSSRHPG